MPGWRDIRIFLRALDQVLPPGVGEVVEVGERELAAEPLKREEGLGDVQRAVPAASPPFRSRDLLEFIRLMNERDVCDQRRNPADSDMRALTLLDQPPNFPAHQLPAPVALG